MADETRDELSAWARECGGYFMRSEQGDAGKLVRLDRVRRWLMAGDDGLPYVQAGEALLAPIERLSHGEIGRWLYLTVSGSHARLVASSDDFSRSLCINWDLQPDPANCGVRGALHHARGCWCEHSGGGKWLGQEAIEPLAVPVAKAHELWGWGEVSVDVPAASPDALTVLRGLRASGSGWTTEQLGLLHAAVEARGGRASSGAVGAVAAALGLSQKAVRNQLDKATGGTTAPRGTVHRIADWPPRRAKR